MFFSFVFVSGADFWCAFRPFSRGGNFRLHNTRIVYSSLTVLGHLHRKLALEKRSSFKDCLASPSRILEQGNKIDEAKWKIWYHPHNILFHRGTGKCWITSPVEIANFSGLLVPPPLFHRQFVIRAAPHNSK